MIPFFNKINIFLIISVCLIRVKSFPSCNYMNILIVNEGSVLHANFIAIMKRNMKHLNFLECDIEKLGGRTNFVDINHKMLIGTMVLMNNPPFKFPKHDLMKIINILSKDVLFQKTDMSNGISYMDVAEENRVSINNIFASASQSYIVQYSLYLKSILEIIYSRINLKHKPVILIDLDKNCYDKSKFKELIDLFGFDMNNISMKEVKVYKNENNFLKLLLKFDEKLVKIDCGFIVKHGIFLRHMNVFKRFSKDEDENKKYPFNDHCFIFKRNKSKDEKINLILNRYEEIDSNYRNKYVKNTTTGNFQLTTQRQNNIKIYYHLYLNTYSLPCHTIYDFNLEECFFTGYEIDESKKICSFVLKKVSNENIQEKKLSILKYFEDKLKMDHVDCHLLNNGLSYYYIFDMNFENGQMDFSLSKNKALVEWANSCVILENIKLGIVCTNCIYTLFNALNKA